jgi:hypothetical protein
MDPDPTPDLTLFFRDFKMWQKNCFLHIFLINYLYTFINKSDTVLLGTEGW